MGPFLGSGGQFSFHFHPSFVFLLPLFCQVEEQGPKIQCGYSFIKVALNPPKPLTMLVLEVYTEK